jgi:hypothetical protein
MLQKALMIAAALSAMVAAAAIGVIAAALAIFEALKGPIGPAGAAGCVAAIAALIIAVAGFVTLRKVEPKGARSESREPVSLVAQLMDLVRDKPVSSMGVAAAAGLMLIRNPTIIGVILRTVLETYAAGEILGKGRGGKR